MDINKGLSLST